MPLLAILIAAAPPPTLAQRAVGLLGVATMLLIAYLTSYDRRRIGWRLVVSGQALQAVFGAFVRPSSARAGRGS